MSFLRIDSRLSIGREYIQHLDGDNPDSVEIESQIVSALVVLIAAEYECILEKLFAERADRCGDREIASFVKNSIRTKIKTPKLNQLKGVLGSFGIDLKEEFTSRIADSSPEGTAWDTIISNRHSVAHEATPPNITILELVTNTYPRSRAVIEELCRILKLSIPQ